MQNLTKEVFVTGQPTTALVGLDHIKAVEITANLFKAIKSAIDVIGLGHNASCIATNNTCLQLTSINFLHLTGQIHLLDENQESLLAATEIGKILGVSTISINKDLETLGFQERVGKTWVPTEAGKPFCRVLDTGKKHSNGTMIQQVKWLETIVDELTEEE